MPVETWLYFTFGFMILGSLIALEIKDILSSIVAIGVVGLGVSAAFLFLQAPDLAIVQFLFEIFALIILIRAFVKREYHIQSPARVGRLMTALSILVLLAVFIAAIPVFRRLPPFGEPAMTVSQHYLDRGLQETGAANLVAAVILDYRGYDTLGEVTVLFTAILGAITILRLRNAKQGEESE